MTRRTFTTRLRAVCVKFACAWVGVASAGCAVLTIDVDVYKGPLSNQPDVQMEQVSGMAMGAKPLLLNLRDRLEVPDDKRLDPPDYNRRAWRNNTSDKKPKHEASWIRDDSNFDSEHAVRVNAVLYLYEDADPGLSPDLKALRHQAIVAMDDYLHSDARLRGDLADATKDWDRVATGILSPFELPREYLKNYREDPLDAAENLEAKLNDVLFGPGEDSLRNAYKTFWIPKTDTGFRHWFPLVNASDDLDAIADRINEAKPPTPAEKLTIVAWESDDTEELTDNPRSNVLYSMLANTRLVESHADLLFGSGRSTEKEVFIARITGIARAFLENRDALSRLFRSCAEAVAVFEPESASEADKAFVDLATRTLVEIVNPLHLLAMLELAKTQPHRVPDSVAILRRAIESIDPGLFTEDFRYTEHGQLGAWDFGKDLAAKTRRLLRDELDLNPQATAFGLLQAHDAFRGQTLFDGMDDPEIEKSAGLDSTNRNLTVRQFGLTSGRQTYTSRAIGAGPLFQALPNNVIDMGPQRLWVETNLADVSAVNAGGLEGGRPQEGVERLIEEYVKARLENPQRRPAPPNVEQARERLLDGLIHFTQKVSILANYTQLLDTTMDPDSRTYGRVLQAVANSITFQVDELRAARNFDDRYRGGRAATESRALDRAQQSTSATQPAGVTPAYEPDPKDAREVLDELIATLEMERILVLRQGGDDSAIGEALDAARVYRADMVYIRPSAAYLRSSFPSTSLQGDPNLLWHNMLKEHGDRTASSIWGDSIVNQRYGKDAARITADIDKQFWQNINRVRVAGGGNTNYVIAKDDIGNWYVKSYSANPEDIIKSARNLALFSMSPSMGANLLDRAEQRDAATPGAPGAPEATERSVTPVQRQFEKFRNNFDEQVEADHAQLEAAIVGATPTAPVLTTTIKNQWAAAGVPVESDSGFASALDDFAANLKPSEEEIDDRSQRIVDRLRAVKEFRASVAARVGRIPAADRTAYDTQQELANDEALKLRAVEQQRDDLETKLQQQQKTLEQHRAEATSFRDRSLRLKRIADDVRESNPERAGELDADAAADGARADKALELAETESVAVNDSEDELVKKRTDVTDARNAADTQAQEAAAAKATYDQTLAHANAAGEALDRIVNALLNRFIDRRLIALDNYANAITIFGSADDK